MKKTYIYLQGCHQESLGPIQPRIPGGGRGQENMLAEALGGQDKVAEALGKGKSLESKVMLGVYRGGGHNVAGLCWRMEGTGSGRGRS